MVFKVGGPVAAVTTDTVNVATVIPPLSDGGIAHFLHCEALGARTIYWRTGLVGDTIAASGNNTLLNNVIGSYMLQVPPGHTHFHCITNGADTVILTPLSGDPRSV